jgi:hypothetical protein
MALEELKKVRLNIEPNGSAEPDIGHGILSSQMI